MNLVTRIQTEIPGKTGTFSAAIETAARWIPAFAGISAAWLVTAAVTPAVADETPKRGGTLTYMIPADGPPSLDGHREGTYATLHMTAPFYSTLIRVNPDNPSSATDFVCDLCTAMPQPTDGGRTWTFKIREGVKFQDGSPLTAADVAASWNEIIFPPDGVLSVRKSNYEMVDKIEAPDPTTVVFDLKFATTAFLPALADPFAFIYEKKIIDKDPHWYESNIMGSGPFKVLKYEVGQSITGVRNPDYYHQGKPYLDQIVGIFAPKQATRVEAIRSDRAQVEFRGLPPSARDELKQALDGQVAVQESVWNCGSVVHFNEEKKPFDDARVRRALSLAIDRWGGAAALSKIADVKTVGSIIFPTSPLAPSLAELHEIAGFWTDIEKSRQEARRLLQEAGQEHLSFELLNRDVDQPYKYVGIWLIDQWGKIGVKVTQKLMPSGPWIAAQRAGSYSVLMGANCHATVNPLIDVQSYLSVSRVGKLNVGNYDDPKEQEIYDKAFRETDPAKQKELMLQFAKWVMDNQAHKLMILWWNRIIPYRAYVKGWKISPSHFINQDLSNIWLDK